MPYTFIPKGLEKLKINCDLYSNADLKQFLLELPTAKIKSLTLLNCNRVFAEDSCFWDEKKNFIFEVMIAISKNQTLAVLSLGEDFTKSFFHKEPHQSIGFNFLLKCHNLKTLIINHGEGWKQKSFATFQEYLTNPRCNLENLELHGTFNTNQLAELAEVFKHATSLKNYEGCNRDKFQEILQDKAEAYEKSLSR